MVCLILHFNNNDGALHTKKKEIFAQAISKVQRKTSICRQLEDIFVIKETKFVKCDELSVRSTQSRSFR